MTLTRSLGTAQTRSRVSTATGRDIDLERFKAVQRLAYEGAEAVAELLVPGMTERDAVHTLRDWLVDHGADDWFHLPFAWFGDRTAFRNFKLPLQFFPSGRKLEAGMPYILDAAPVVGGATADIGYAGCLGDNAALDQVLDDLAAHRALIVDLVRERRTFRQVYEAVDRLAVEQGYANRHHAYPGHVIAHEVLPLAESTRAVPRMFSSGTMFGFGRRHLRSLFRSVVNGRRSKPRWSPLWAGDRRSDHRPVNGLWAVEPHLGLRGVGAKFEEFLVVTDDDAFWLDDDLPHTRRWLARGITDFGQRQQ